MDAGMPCSFCVASCNGREYNPSIQFCYGNAVYGKCDGREYNPLSQFCDGVAIYGKCGALLN